MHIWLSKLRAGKPASQQTPAYGFVYVADVDDGPMKGAEAGATIRNLSDRPPWIVVGHSIESIIVARWPGRLWKVEILVAAPEQVSSSAKYTRAVAVRVLEELPAATLFGAQGDMICRIIEKANLVEITDVEVLGRSPHSSARDAYSRAWSTWLARMEPGPTSGDQDHADTLEVVSRKSGARSPIGMGFAVLNQVMVQRARGLAGDTAFVIDEEGDAFLVPAWGAACDVFLHAAMGFGAPELPSPHDVKLLTSAFVAHYGEV